VQDLQEEHSTQSNDYRDNHANDDQYPSLLAYSSTTKILTTRKINAPVHSIYSTNGYLTRQSSSMGRFENSLEYAYSTTVIYQPDFTTHIHAYATSPINAKSSSIKLKTDAIKTIAENPYEIENENENEFADVPEFQPLVRIKILSNPIRDHVENGTVKLQCLSSNFKIIKKTKLIQT
jgi:hypothetical protein